MSTPRHHHNTNNHGMTNLGRQLCLLLLGLVIGLRLFLWQLGGSKAFRARVHVVNGGGGGSDDGGHLPYGERDDLRYGKSCTYTNAGRGFHGWFWTTILGRNPWSCKECDNRGICKPLKPRGRCRPFRRKEVDDVIPRVYTEYSPYTYQKSHTLSFHHDGHTEYAKHNIPDCSATLSLPCFDLDRCPRFGPLKVYGYGSKIQDRIDKTINETKIGILQLIRVDSPSDACLLVMGVDSFTLDNNPNDLNRNNPNWNGGQNHYLFGSTHFFGEHGDRPFNSKFDFGMASTSQWSVDDAILREGYDTPLGLGPKWKRPQTQQYKQLKIHRKRRLLIAFKGNIYPWEQRNWQHRWIASEYWTTNDDNPDDVYVDTKCKGHNYHTDTSPESYEELLLNSTFFFCPGGGGGGGTDSYRFAEALDGGAIPVVTSDFVPPFFPDIDWTTCIVQISEARVIDIPNFLRDNISPKEIRIRQRNCANLHAKVYGSGKTDTDDDDPVVQNQFAVAMQVWAIRIKNALRRKFEVADTILEIESD